MGQFVHLMRRNLPMIYIIENNGVYGLTKGQFSATADIGSKLKTGVVNDLPAIDTCALAIQLGATFVGRSFSGDKKQLLSMLKAAIAHKGTVLLDVISPCVTFNDHEGSTKSYKFMQENDEPINEIGFVPASTRSKSITTPARSTRWRCTTAPTCACASCTRTTTPPTRPTPCAP
jgi:2-oxoglutarate/2-oxoacid ferredoxin oxidoreductase subunit beta